VNANGSVAVAVYRPETPGARPTASNIQVLDVVGGRISVIQAFVESALLRLFGLRVDPVS
jgi:hypothetical protein